MLPTRMPLEGVLNLRELGGYPLRNGGRTRLGQYLRSDRLEDATERDCEFLYQYGLRYEVDLRSRSEIKGHMTKLFGYKEMVYMSVSLLDEVIESPTVDDFPDSMGYQYVQLLDQFKWKMKTIFSLFAAHTDHCFMFHCAAGKDRTGVVALLLLDLAGVPDEYIVRDYTLTDEYIDSFVVRRTAELKAQGINYPDHVFRAKPESIQMAIDYLRDSYGGSRNYLLDCGLRNEQLNQILDRFVEKAPGH